jgi:hypothetical protein
VAVDPGVGLSTTRAFAYSVRYNEKPLANEGLLKGGNRFLFTRGVGG